MKTTLVAWPECWREQLFLRLPPKHMKKLALLGGTAHQEKERETLLLAWCRGESSSSEARMNDDSSQYNGAKIATKIAKISKWRNLAKVH